MGTVSDRRWPVAPLMKELGVTTPGELAVACGVDEWAAERAMSYGLTLTDLDAWCAAAEITPGEVWPEFAPPRASKSKLPSLLCLWREHPGRWVRVGSWDSPGAAYTAASALRKHGFEVRTSRSSDGPGAFLYARWPESAAARKVG